MRQLITILITTAWLMACSSGDNTESTAEGAKSHVFEAQQAALEKAKQVEADLQKRAEEQKAKLDSLTQ